MRVDWREPSIRKPPHVFAGIFYICTNLQVFIQTNMSLYMNKKKQLILKLSAHIRREHHTQYEYASVGLQ